MFQLIGLLCFCGLLVTPIAVGNWKSLHDSPAYSWQRLLVSGTILAMTGPAVVWLAMRLEIYEQGRHLGLWG